MNEIQNRFCMQGRRDMEKGGDPWSPGVMLVCCQPEAVVTCARLSPPAQQPGHHVPVLCWQPKRLNFDRATNQ